MSTEQIATQHLGHLGILSGIIKQLGIVKKVDDLLPISKNKGAIVSMGERVSAMILNGLGFLNDRLYMHPIFFEDKPLDSLIGKGIKAEHLNDDALGDCLDAIYVYGCSKFFSDIAFKIAYEKKLFGKFSRVDTTSLSVHGDYEEQDEEAISITHGYSKQHRFDLKQVVLSLTVNGPSDLPIWIEGLSGNSSDKKSIKATAQKIEEFKKQLKEAPSFIYVADSALYSKELLKSPKLRWITRVPESISEANKLTQRTDFNWIKLNDEYKVVNLKSDYGGLEQRWQIVYSRAGYEREIKTLEKNITKEHENFSKELKKLGTYKCEPDAIKPIIKLQKKIKYHQINATYVAVSKYSKRGKPSPDSQKEIVHYKIEAQLVRDEDLIAKAKTKCGKFILATNELDEKELPNEILLTEYKHQSSVERGFRFIKNNEFMVSSLYLKKNSRIEALLVIMTICLMVYNFGQYKFRKALEIAKDTVPDQKNKPTKNPTLRWIFRLLYKITIVRIIDPIKNLAKRIVSNLCDTSKKIIRYFGEEAMLIYEIN
jgi:transposase